MSVEYGFCLPEYPWITGREMAGIVEKVGDDVRDLKVGDKVWTSKLPYRYARNFERKYADALRHVL